MSAHETWCDTQNKISERCNCMAGEYIDEIESLEEKLAIAVEALEFIARDLDQIGVTPTEVSHLAKCRQTLAKIKGGAE